MTTTSNASNAPAQTTALQLAPYIFFYGRCEEALEFYKKVLGGTYEMMRMADAPKEMIEHVPADFRNKVMHASFTAPGVVFMASDGREAKTIDPDAGNISLALSAKDRAEGDRVFKALSEGGNVTMPLDDAFWGGRFGTFNDRFGIEWRVTSP
jgi:PhnB protein